MHQRAPIGPMPGTVINCRQPSLLRTTASISVVTCSMRSSRRRQASSRSPTILIIQGDRLKIREPIRHVTAIPTATITVAATVREVRHHDCHSPHIRGGPTGFRGSMPSVRACRHVLPRLSVMSPAGNSLPVCEHGLSSGASGLVSAAILASAFPIFRG